jgi:hypothetical protein
MIEMKKLNRYSVIVNVNLEYIFKAKNEEEAKVKVENVELPGEYVTDSFELVKIGKLDNKGIPQYPD